MIWISTTPTWRSLARANARREHAGKLARDGALRAVLQQKLELNWSPQQIAAGLGGHHADRSEWNLDHISPRSTSSLRHYGRVPRCPMHMIYIDDSVQKEPRRQHLGELVSVGGVIVSEPAVAAFAAALDGIRTDLRIPEGKEIKWKPPKSTFQASAGGELIADLRQRMLQAAIDNGIKSAVVVWDRAAGPGAELPIARGPQSATSRSR